MINEYKDMTIGSGTKNHKKGYLLLLAVLLASIILSIGLGIFVIINKSLILASTGRDSQFAFYAADSGIECALYWDRRHAGFSTGVFATSTGSLPPSSGVLCNSADIASSWTISNQTANTADTAFNMAFANGTCTTVTVKKSDSGLTTRLEAFGFNTCNTQSPRRIERAVRVRY